MNLKNIAIGIAIIILTSFVTIYGIALLYPQLDYNDYCNNSKQGVLYDSEQACVIAGGKWNSVQPYETVPSSKPVTGYCDTEFYCRQDYEDAMKKHFRQVFYVALPLGIAILIAGAIFFGLESVGAGLMGGGIVTLIYGAGGYWQYAENWLKFLLSLAGLVIVIYFAYWFNKRSKKSAKKSSRKK
jgi:hypothetical protein